MFQRFDVDESARMGHLRVGLAIEQQLVLERLATTTPMHEQIFKLDQAREVDLQLRVAPPRVLAYASAAKAIVGASQVMLRTVLIDHLNEQTQEPPRLRRQIGPDIIVRTN